MQLLRALRQTEIDNEKLTNQCQLKRKGIRTEGVRFLGIKPGTYVSFVASNFQKLYLFFLVWKIQVLSVSSRKSIIELLFNKMHSW